MKVGLDTSVVVRLLTREPADLAGVAFYLRSGADEMATFEKAAAKLSAVHILAI